MLIKDSGKLREDKTTRGFDYEENVKSSTTLLLFIFNSLLTKDVYWSFMLFSLGLIFLQTTVSLIIFRYYETHIYCYINFNSKVATMAR